MAKPAPYVLPKFRFCIIKLYVATKKNKVLLIIKPEIWRNEIWDAKFIMDGIWKKSAFELKRRHSSDAITSKAKVSFLTMQNYHV